MASSAARGGDRAIHQDYIARIRYSNTLPPPPNPPKLLDIPNTGLASGQYTNPGFASRLAREQPLNIEADAELGMPIDLVGMPGIFDGDESSIQAPLHQPVPHPHDRALLRPLASLGKPKTSESGVSFLRRTEYISAYSGGRKARSDPSLLASNANRVKKLPVDVDKDSPEYIKAKIERSFDVAQAKLKNATSIRHPTKRNVRLVSALPFIPDLHATSDYGGYVNVKFSGYPVPAGPKYDTRLEAAIIRAVEAPPEVRATMEAAQVLHDQDPTRYPPPPVSQDYELYLLDKVSDALNYKRKIDVTDLEKDNDDLYTFDNEAGNKVFRFNRVRGYETEKSVDQFSPASRYSGKDCELIVAENDGRDGKRQKAMHYYPIVQKQSVRPQRKKNMDQRRYGYHEEEQDTSVDNIDMTIRDQHETEELLRSAWAMNPLKGPEEEGQGGGDEKADADADGDADAEADEEEPTGRENGHSDNALNGHTNSGDDDAAGSEA